MTTQIIDFRRNTGFLGLACLALLVACGERPGSQEPEVDTDSEVVQSESSNAEPEDSGGVDVDSDERPNDANVESGTAEDVVDPLDVDEDEIGEFMDGPPPLMSEDAFLAAFLTLEDVTETDSGLMYRVIETGAGASPGPFDRVRVAYRGTLMDGTVFDETPLGESTVFPVSGLIPGWREALQLMNEGDRWEIAIPSHLAYGERGAEGFVPPNSPLVFELTLLDVLPRE